MTIFTEVYQYRPKYVFYIVAFLLFFKFLFSFLRTKTYFRRWMKNINNFIYSLKFLYQLLCWKFGDSSFFFQNRYESGYRILNLLFIKQVYICHPVFIQKLMNDSENINKSELYVGFKDWIGNSVLMRNGDEYKERMKILSPFFRSKVLYSFIPLIEKIARKIFQDIKGYKDDVLILPLMKKHTFDMLYETILGIEENSPLKKNRSEYAKVLMATLYPVLNRAANFFLSFDTIFYLTRIGKKFKTNKARLREITKEIVKEKLRLKNNMIGNIEEQEVKKISFLDVLLQSMNNKEEIVIERVYEDIELMLFAGFDTISLTTCWSLYLLGQHPDIQKRVKEEISAIFGDDTDRSITIDDLREMKYLECVVKETLRLFPPVPFISRKANKPISFDDEVFTEDWTYVISIFHLHRNPYIYENPESFIPDRFLPENSINRNPYAFIPFSGGSRICLGHRLAMLEIKIILSTILRSSSIQCVDEMLTLFFRISLNPNRPFRLKFIFENE